MKHLGIDFGMKRVGIAISNDDGTMSFPKNVFENGPELISKIKKIIFEEDIERIIIGESKNYDMKDNDIMVKIREFANNLSQETGCDIVFHPEFMTSMQVEREHFQMSEKGKTRGMSNAKGVDSRAATLILQSYLDSNK